MTTAISASAQWQAPAEDGRILIWPEVDRISEQLRENQRQLGAADSVVIQNVPLAALRRHQRHWIGHRDDDQPLIATGHQIELYHPGVWAKNIFASRLAQETGGSAYHLAIDTDAPRHLFLRWPGASHAITDDPRLPAAAWAEQLDPPTPHYIDRIERELAAASRQWGFQPMLVQVLAAFRRLSLESPSLTWVLTNALHQVEWELGLRHHALLAGPIWLSPAWLAFVHHVLASAQAFHHAYNAILADYRREQRIRNPGRPWPDLRSSPDNIEVPLWLDSLATGQRQRAYVARGPAGWKLHAGPGVEFPLDPAADGWAAAERLGQFLTENALRLSPRAMTLTLFLRLFIADQFIHGIGGARYDRITDRLIERCFGLRAPAFAVTTATLLFPTAAGQQRIGLRELEQEGRRLRHGWRDPDKMEMVRRIATLPRQSPERHRLFQEMHRRLDGVIHQPGYREWQRRYEQARRLHDQKRELFDRELFFAIQPEARLKMLIARYDDAFARR